MCQRACRAVRGLASLAELSRRSRSATKRASAIGQEAQREGLDVHAAAQTRRRAQGSATAAPPCVIVAWTARVQLYSLVQDRLAWKVRIVVGHDGRGLNRRQRPRPGAAVRPRGRQVAQRQRAPRRARVAPELVERIGRQGRQVAVPRHGARRRRFGARWPDDGYRWPLRRRQRNEAMRKDVRRPSSRVRPRLGRAELADLVELPRVVAHVGQRAADAGEE